MKRRDFLHTAASAAAAGALPRYPEFSFDASQWQSVRKQFLIAKNRIYLNVGTLGAQPRVVVDAVMDATRKTAETFPPGVKWDEINKAVAALLDCDADGLAFPRNTTEAMNFAANGLDLAAGDHIVTTNHEHIGGLCCWQLVSKRRGCPLTQVDLSAAPQDRQVVFERMTSAVTDRTRVMSVSHVNFSTGFLMPVKRLAQWCRQRGIIFVIDGAHPPGLMRVSIRDIDPDFYASSPHKWLLAAQGIGLLYMRKEWRTKLWPTEASGDWDNLALGTQRFNHLGTIDESRYAGLQAALAFHTTLGADRVYARIEELRQHMFAVLGENARVHIVTPRDQSAGMVSFKVDGIESLELQKRLAAYNIRTRVIGEYNYGYMRLSAHVYNSFDEIERVGELITKAS